MYIKFYTLFFCYAHICILITFVYTYNYIRPVFVESYLNLFIGLLKLLIFYNLSNWLTVRCTPAGASAAAAAVGFCILHSFSSNFRSAFSSRFSADFHLEYECVSRLLGNSRGCFCLCEATQTGCFFSGLCPFGTF